MKLNYRKILMMVDQDTIDTWTNHIRSKLSTDRHASMVTTFVLKCGNERIILSKKIVNNKVQMIIEMFNVIEVGQIERDDVDGIVKFLTDMVPLMAVKSVHLS